MRQLKNVLPFSRAGIYEAIDGDFLDSYSLSLLNPYMVSNLFVLAIGFKWLSLMVFGI